MKDKIFDWCYDHPVLALVASMVFSMTILLVIQL